MFRKPKPVDPVTSPTVALGRGGSGSASGLDLERQLEGLQAAVIMMADDEPTTLEVLELCLRDAGYRNFVTTTQPSRVLELVGEHAPDVLLLDLHMPGLEGFDILTAIRRHPSHSRVPVVILTSSTDPETKLKALELGATDFLGKPADPSELALRLRNTLSAKAYQDRLRFFDAATGLPNRDLLVQRLRGALSRESGEVAPGAILRVQIDRFKEMREGLASDARSDLAKMIADRLEMCAQMATAADDAGGEGALLARVASDEFALFLPGTDSAQVVERVAERIRSRLGSPLRIGGRELLATCSIGCALCPEDGRDPEALLASAEVAMSHARQGGGNDYQFHRESLNAERNERLDLEKQLRGAHERKELFLEYQPQLDLHTGRVTGTEVLLRWRHPSLGLIPPERFIPLAEQSGQIGALGGRVLHAACLQTKLWNDAYPGALRVAVNVSARQVRRGNLVKAVEKSLAASELDPSCLVVELTERALVDEPQQAAEALAGLAALGVRTSIDDLGTATSSLTALKRLDVHEVKIDRSLVKGLPSDADDAAVVAGIVALAHELGLRVVAEGVETPEQLAFLAERGCDAYQGFLFSRPVGPRELPTLLRRDGRLHR